jgi:hypothetical protein
MNQSDTQRSALIAEAQRLGIASPDIDSPSLARACHLRWLTGGLSFAGSLQPDDALGPLLYALGGTAKRLRVLDVSTDSPSIFDVALDRRRERWTIADVPELIGQLNALFCGDDSVKAVVALGEWEDMQQWWCVPKAHLASLQRLGLPAPHECAAE